MSGGLFLRAPRGWGAAPANPPVTGTKAFVDEALPAGVEHVQYRVQSQRGVRTSGPSATLVVNIGKVAAGDDARASAVRSADALADEPTRGTRAGKSQNLKTSRS